MDILGEVILMILGLAKILIFASIIVSWVGDQSNQFVQMIHAATEPMYRPVRRFTSKIPGPLDWSPIAVLLIIFVLGRLVEKYMLPSAGMILR